MSDVPSPLNEPVLAYAPGSPERSDLETAVLRLAETPTEVPLFIDGKRVMEKGAQRFTCPHRHSLELGAFSVANTAHVASAIESAERAKHDWANSDFSARAAIFLRAAELLAGPWRQRVNAATVLNQSKTPHQAEIDAACELIDFFRFNVYFAEQLSRQQPRSERGIWNQTELRPLDGFVYAVSPFNFTSIAGNLPTAPALLGNTVLWKPSPLAALSGHVLMELLVEAGLPPGVINLVQGDPAAITKQVVSHPGFAGLHFTGSTAILKSIWLAIAENMERYRTYPRIVGESGGKDFVFAHPSADPDALAVAILRGGFEFQGQKCSAASRIYVPKSLWPKLEEQLVGMLGQVKVGDPMAAGIFMGAVIGRNAYDKITSYIQLAKDSSDCRLVHGGTASDSEGFFVQPTLVETQDPKHRLMQEEIFGPVVTLFAYDDARYEDTLALCDQTSPYGLTGAIFARDRAAIVTASRVLRHAAGNFYINDKPTGAVVGQQPFGGGRMSGTNDKAGAAWNLMRWAQPRTIKENLSPPHDWRYPYMGR
jgi:1-pyrroline-5-carboxylate dehydrogenase